MADEDEAGFAELYRASYGPLVAQVYAVTGDLGDAQEAVQEAFVRAWPRWGQISTYDNPRAWVATVARRVAVSRWRRARNAVRGWVERGPAADLPGPGAESVALVRALRTLPESQRRALVLHHMGDRSVAEIAADEGVAPGTVKARLSRGRAALARLLDSETADPDGAAREVGSSA